MEFGDDPCWYWEGRRSELRSSGTVTVSFPLLMKLLWTQMPSACMSKVSNRIVLGVVKVRTRVDLETVRSVTAPDKAVSKRDFTAEALRG